MNSLLRVVMLLALSVIFGQNIQAQRLIKNLADKAKQKVEEKIEQRVEKKVEDKVDEKIDTELDKIEDSFEKNNGSTGDGNENDSAVSQDEKNQQRMKNLLSGMGISTDPVPVADSYSFDHLIQMHIESSDGDGKKTSDGEFITHFSPNSKSMAYEAISGEMSAPGKGMFIVDAENGAIVVLSQENGQKTGIVYGMGAFFQTMGETYNDEETEKTLEETPEMYLANPNVKKTGRTKTIAGYKCDEYEYSDEETESQIWITQDLKLNTQDFFSTLFKTSLYSRGFPWGYMMEAKSKDKESGEVSVMTVTRVDANSNKKFSLSDYQITNLGSLQMPKE